MKTHDNGALLARRKIGRPSKLTPPTRDTILAAVKCGASFRTACMAGGVSETTFYNWKNRAAEPNAPQDYVEFLQQLTHAIEEGQAARLALIMQAARSDWRAASWLCERIDPKRWSLRFQIEHSVTEKPFTFTDAMAAIECQERLYAAESAGLLEGSGTQ